jgi:hypothetical protein
LQAFLGAFVGYIWIIGYLECAFIGQQRDFFFFKKAPPGFFFESQCFADLYKDPREMDRVLAEADLQRIKNVTCILLGMINSLHTVEIFD